MTSLDLTQFFRLLPLLWIKKTMDKSFFLSILTQNGLILYSINLINCLKHTMQTYNVYFKPHY